jgi:ubiquitin-protein ligase
LEWHNNWTAARTLLFVNFKSVHENRIYALRLHCGEKYPDQPPNVSFVSKINLPCVNQSTGKVEPSKLNCLSNWKRTFSMETVLAELRRFCLSILMVGKWRHRQTGSYSSQQKEVHFNKLRMRLSV